MPINSKTKQEIEQEEAEKIVLKYIELKDKSKDSVKDEKEFKKWERFCLDHFKYIPQAKANKYKNFPNHEDLFQEGMVALVRALKSYQPGKGNFFWWAHKYVDTKIARHASLHTAIRFPLKKARELLPTKSSSMPAILDHDLRPDVLYETRELCKKIQFNKDSLSPDQKIIFENFFEPNGEELNFIELSKKIGISKITCSKLLKQTIKKVRKDIK